MPLPPPEVSSVSLSFVDEALSLQEALTTPQGNHSWQQTILLSKRNEYSILLLVRTRLIRNSG